jgi:hypothetical protein
LPFALCSLGGETPFFYIVYMYKMDEISKIGDINSVNDFLDFKLSVKTIIFMVMIWSGLCIIVFVIIMGGVNNSIAYLTSMLDSTKNTIIKIKTDVTSNGSSSSSDSGSSSGIGKNHNTTGLAERKKTDEDD